MRNNFLRKNVLGVVILFLGPMVTAFGQVPSSDAVVLVQGVVLGMHGPEQVRLARQAITGIPEVRMVRVCPDSRNLFIHAVPEHQLTEAGLNALLVGAGVQVRCLRQLEAGQDFIRIDATTCAGPAPGQVNTDE